MNKFLLILMTPVLLAGCYMGVQGELVGVQPREYWDQPNPYGMNYIHFGSYTMGPSDQDVPYALNTRAKTLQSLHSTWMCTNLKQWYRQFVYYVRDSLFLNTLAENDDDRYFYAENAAGQELDRFIDKGYINWEEPIDWTDEDIFDIPYDEYFLQGSDRFYNRREIDTRKLNYRYYWFNLENASSKKGRDEEYGEVNELNQLPLLSVTQIDLSSLLRNH